MIAFPVAVKAAPVPKRSAAAADKLQWYAMHYPDALRTMMDAIDFAMDHDREEEAAQILAARIVRPPSRRASPVPALTIETNARLEYTAIRVTDERALLAAAETRRLGRYMGDVIHADAMERHLKTLRKVQTSGRGHHYHATHNGVRWRVAILIPSPDRTVTTLTEAKSNGSTG